MTQTTVLRAQFKAALVTYCYKKECSIDELSELFIINKHTLRAGYIYPLIKEGKIKRCNSNKGGPGTRYTAVL